jgi:hypothetical protein
VHSAPSAFIARPTGGWLGGHAVAESFFATLKIEALDDRIPHDHDPRQPRFHRRR